VEADILFLVLMSQQLMKWDGLLFIMPAMQDI
jgi:hypothetical protein